MRRTRKPRSRLLGQISVACAVLLLVSACTASGSSVETDASASGATALPSASTSLGVDGDDLDAQTRFTPLITSTVTVPAPVMGTDGKIHLAYELLLTNASSSPFSVTSLQVKDAETGVPLLAIGTDELHAVVTKLGASSDGTAEVGPITIAPAETWIAWIDVQLDGGADVPQSVAYTALGALLPDGRDPIEVDAGIGVTEVNDEPATELSMPVGAGTWYMSEGCCSEPTHHRRGFAPVNGQGLVSQRFAIDFFRLDDKYQAWEGDPSKLSSYFSYQQPILAAAAGTVVRSVDGFPNTSSLPGPPPIPPIKETVGNHVVVEIAPGLYALYGHMDTGSVRVNVGDIVTVGQELGLIGSSGNSTTPHLHFHLQNSPNFFPSDGVPYVFDEFELVGSITERIWDDDLGLGATGELPFAEVEPSTRHDELPLDRTVVRLPAG